MSSSALAVMLKAPVPGKVKTRLCPPLTVEQAAGLYEAFIKDTFFSVRSLEGIDLYAAYAPEKDTSRLQNLIPKGVEVFKQDGEALGDRIYSVFKYLFEKGYEKVSVIGSDSPDLPGEYIYDAFVTLESCCVEAVLGPARDGGYYLIAMRRLLKAPFEAIPWSTNRVLSETMIKLRESGIRFKLLKPWHDIDTAKDLGYLEDNPNAPESAAFLAEIGLENLK